MKDFFAFCFVAILAIGALVGLSIGGYHLYAYLAPKYESTRRDVMLESRAYSEGQTREIYRLKLQYQQAKSDDERSTIRAMALHEASAFDRHRLPFDLQSFIQQLGG
jgi:hypothetical protein